MPKVPIRCWCRGAKGAGVMPRVPQVPRVSVQGAIRGCGNTTDPTYQTDPTYSPRAPSAPSAPPAPSAPERSASSKFHAFGFSAPVVEGDDSEALRGAAGHLPDTPHPWENGNSAIAAHRDGLFRPLRHIRVGDELRVQTAARPIRYKVKDTHIVQPTDLSVLQPTAGADADADHLLSVQLRRLGAAALHRPRRSRHE